MLITLITPPSEFLLDNRVFVSLGILKVGATLEQAGHKVEHLDLSGVTNFQDVVRDYCQSTDSRVFGITATSPQMPATMRIASTVRRELPDAKIILGGPHATLVNAAAKNERKKSIEGRALRSLAKLHEHFTVLVAGDGERAISDAITSDELLIDADDPKSPLWLTSQGFTDSAWPARHLVDMDSYHYSIEGKKATSLISQLGCSFHCNFCAGRNSPMLRRIRLRPPENVIAEMVHLYDTYGITGCMYLDDELNINKQMIPLMNGLRDAALERGIEWRLRGFLKAELFTEEQAKAMYEAGFRQLLIGFESGSERILTNIEKNATRAENTRAVEIAHANGLKVKALMSVGHAGESEETILATLDWLLEVKPSDADVTIVTPYPGSPYYDDSVPHADGVWCFTAKKTGDRLYMNDVDFTTDAHYYKGAPGAYVSYVWTDHITPERLVEMRDMVEREYRTQLNVPFYQTGTAEQYEHSMGQTRIPSHILRGTACQTSLS